MVDLSVGAVGAAIIAGLVSILGLIIGKEQKVSEFRQAWIDELRKCFVNYLVNINSIADAVRLSKANKQASDLALVESYKALNEASHGIDLRINAKEQSAKDHRTAMSKFEEIAKENANLTPEKILDIEKEFLEAARVLLKFEWKRVKRGERAFLWTKRIVLASIIVMLLTFLYLSFAKHLPENYRNELGKFQLIKV